jgi:hypothetical protein
VIAPHGEQRDRRRQTLCSKAPGDLGVPEQGALPGRPVHRRSVANRCRGSRAARPSANGLVLRECHPMPAGHRGELVGVPEGELPHVRQHPRVRKHRRSPCRRARWLPHLLHHRRRSGPPLSPRSHREPPGHHHAVLRRADAARDRRTPLPAPPAKRPPRCFRLSPNEI